MKIVKPYFFERKNIPGMGVYMLNFFDFVNKNALLLKFTTTRSDCTIKKCVYLTTLNCNQNIILIFKIISSYFRVNV